ncbi:MAG: phospho-N-acetylmuramoyl-pentapeptide-transferase [Planctomycetes bacterium]|nr:phospho-N-acetylmuramoyl-pentapeptide-transferase [Planctomycetota bacterium]
MFYFLKDLDGWYGPFRLFGYVTSRTVLAALTAFALMMVVMPPLIRWLKRKKFGEQGSKNEAAVVDAMRNAKAGTPTMGGLGIIACICASVLLWCNPLELRTWLLLGGMLGFGLVGYLDDRTKIFKGAKGISSRSKLAIQLVIGLLCGGAMYWYNAHNLAALAPKLVDTQIGVIQVFKHISDTRDAAGNFEQFLVPLGVHELAFPLLPLQFAVNLGLWWILWSVLVTMACANAVNFTDGMDGLASGTMLIAALAFMAIAYLTSRVDTTEFLKVLYVPGGQEVAVFCAAVAGACLGFLWFNGAPAEVFMGDTGSQALGGFLALAALNTRQEFLVLLVGFVFFIEALSVLLQVASYRLRNKKRIFLCAPLHHHFQYKGWPESKIVLRFWIVAALAALLALSTLKLR